MKDPAFLFYYQDFAYGTRKMSFAEKGAYIELLCEQADTGHLDLEKDIKRILKNDFPIWDAICDKFTCDSNGLFFNEVLEEHINKRAKYTESRRNNLKKVHMPVHMEEHMQPHMVNVNENVNKDVILLKDSKFNKETILQYFTDKGYPEEQGEQFYNHYSAQGWVTGSGLPITNWKLKAENWHKEQSRRELNAKSKQIDSRGKGAIDFNKYDQLRKINPGT